MRKRLAIAAATVAALTGAAFGMLSADADYYVRNDLSRCAINETKTRHTAVANSFARVWERHRSDRNFLYRDHYACSNRVGRHIKLATTRFHTNGQFHSDIEVSENSINAQYVAFVLRVCPDGLDDPCTYELVQRKLKNGSNLRQISSQTPLALVRPLVFGAGTLAYGRSTAGCQPCEIRLVTRAGDRTVDIGNDVEPHSLGFSMNPSGDGILTWVRGNNARATTAAGREYE